MANFANLSSNKELYGSYVGKIIVDPPETGDLATALGAGGLIN